MTELLALPNLSSWAAPTQNFVQVAAVAGRRFQKSPYWSTYITESCHSGASRVDAGTFDRPRLQPAAPASHTRSGAWVLRASMNADTGTNDAIPLQAWSPFSSVPASTLIISSSTV